MKAKFINFNSKKAMYYYLLAMCAICIALGLLRLNINYLAPSIVFGVMGLLFSIDLKRHIAMIKFIAYDILIFGALAGVYFYIDSL